jgi:hypothetical protein
MTVQGFQLNTTQAVTAGVVIAVSAALGVLAVRIWRASRISPEEKERRRREAIASYGKTADAMLVDIQEKLLFYSYTVRGVEYTASQDVGFLQEQQTAGLELGMKPIMVRYDSRNPANSIVVSEQWSGLTLGSGREQRSKSQLG